MASSKGGLVKRWPRQKVASSKGGLVKRWPHHKVVSSRGGLVKRVVSSKGWSRQKVVSFLSRFFLTEAQETCVGPLDLAPEAVHAV